MIRSDDPDIVEAYVSAPQSRSPRLYSVDLSDPHGAAHIGCADAIDAFGRTGMQSRLRRMDAMHDDDATATEARFGHSELPPLI
jgi:hypothetical protein